MPGYRVYREGRLWQFEEALYGCSAPSSEDPWDGCIYWLEIED